MSIITKNDKSLQDFENFDTWFTLLCKRSEMTSATLFANQQFLKQLLKYLYAVTTLEKL